MIYIHRRPTTSAKNHELQSPLPRNETHLHPRRPPLVIHHSSFVIRHSPRSRRSFPLDSTRIGSGNAGLISGSARGLTCAAPMTGAVAMKARVRFASHVTITGTAPEALRCGWHGSSCAVEQHSGPDETGAGLGVHPRGALPHAACLDAVHHQGRGLEFQVSVPMSWHPTLSPRTSHPNGWNARLRAPNPNLTCPPPHRCGASADP
jgi:hypothetical protein